MVKAAVQTQGCISRDIRVAKMSCPGTSGYPGCPGSHDIPALLCPGSRGTSGCATCRDIPMLSRHNIKLKLVRPGYRTRHVPKLYFLRTFLYDKGTLRVLLQYPGICRDMQNSMSRDIGTWPGHGTSGHGISTCPGSRRDMGHWDPGPGRHNYTTLSTNHLDATFSSALRRRFRRLFVEDGTHFFAVFLSRTVHTFSPKQVREGISGQSRFSRPFSREHGFVLLPGASEEACSSAATQVLPMKACAGSWRCLPGAPQGRARPGLLLPLGCPSAPWAAPEAAPSAGAAPPRPRAAVAAARGLRFLRGAASRLSPPRVPTFASSVAAGAVAGATAAALTTALTCSNPPAAAAAAAGPGTPQAQRRRGEEGVSLHPLPPLQRLPQPQS